MAALKQQLKGCSRNMPAIANRVSSIATAITEITEAYRNAEKKCYQDFGGSDNAKDNKSTHSGKMPGGLSSAILLGMRKDFKLRKNEKTAGYRLMSNVQKTSQSAVSNSTNNKGKSNDPNLRYEDLIRSSLKGTSKGDDNNKNKSSQNSNKTSKNTPIITKPDITEYGYGITSTLYDIKFNSRYDARTYIDGLNGGPYDSYVDFVSGLITEALTKSAVPGFGTAAGLSMAAIDTGYNIMYDGVLDQIDEIKTEKVCITVTKWNIPQNHGFGYLDTIYSVSSWK
ncbi:MAG: hypothetical protein Q8880_11550 [Bacteroidota bacterium]|nr:hypothetical protein [Bacteroidota bacterium]